MEYAWGFILGILYCARKKLPTTFDGSEVETAEYKMVDEPCQTPFYPERDPHLNDTDPDVYNDGGRMS